jgi:hypothetical protein
MRKHEVNIIINNMQRSQGTRDKEFNKVEILNQKLQSKIRNELTVHTVKQHEVMTIPQQVGPNGHYYIVS